MAAITWLCDHFLSLLAVGVAFGFIIAIHEFGHFIMARRVGIRCPKFAIGFGPRLFSFDFRGTEFSICLLPLGGYVMMLGEDPESDDAQEDFSMVSSYLHERVLPAKRDDIANAIASKEDEIEDTPEARKRFQSVLGHIRYLPDKQYETVRQLEGNFNDATIPQRMAVILGGVTMNFISALLLFCIIGGCYGLVDLSPKSLPIVMKVLDNSPAAAVGLEYGDKITAIDSRAIVSGSDMVKAISELPGVKTSFAVERGEEKLTFDIVPNVLVGDVVFHPDKLAAGKLPQVVEISDISSGTISSLKVGDVVTAVDGNPVDSLESMVTIFKNIYEANKSKDPVPDMVEVKVAIQGRGDIDMKVPIYALEPVGKIGIMPAQVTEFKFIEHTTNEVQSVAEGSVAAKLGFQANDVIYFLNGAKVADIDSLNEIFSATDSSVSAEHPLIFDVIRGDKHVVIKSSEAISDGVTMGLTMRPITMGLVVSKSLSMIGRMIISPIIIVQQMVNKMLSPALVKASMSGPLGIMQMIFELSDDGLGKLLYITALINAAVGAFNVIPFPALDGARFFVLLFGWVRGREVDPRKEAMVHQVGLFILLGLVLLVTFLDIQRIFAGVPLTK